MKKSTIIVAIVAMLIATGGITAGTYVNDRMMEKAAKKMASDEMKDEDMEKEDEYSLQFLSGIQYQPGQPVALEFTVVDKNGHRLRQDDYKITHEKRMHVIVASSDLAQFQHVHPVFDTGTSTYKLPGFVFPTAGHYRIFTDFEVAAHGDGSEAMDMAKHAGVQYQDVLVGNPADYRPQALGPATTADNVDGNTVDLKISNAKDGHAKTEKRLDFTLTRDGKKVIDLQKYLGALGHLVILREGDLEYLHTHALTQDTNHQTGTVSFEADFKQPGNYKAFAQFQRDGQVMTTEFVINVE
jgi:hypothetical protein